MKKIVLFICLLVLVSCLGACTREKERILSPLEVKSKVDSLTAVKVAAIKAQAKEDLDVRIAIEVKPKADSIVAAKKYPHKDTAKNKNIQQQQPMPKSLLPMTPLRKSVNK